MINSYPKNQMGAATLLITTLLLVSVSMIAIFVANYSVMQQKISANAKRNLQAFQAAEAGLEFGINYLQKNSATILATKSGGFVQPYSDSSTSNVTLANGSKYTISYTNPVANNYQLIQITSTGTNDDGSATRAVQQQVKFGSIIFAPPTTPLVSKGSVIMGGSNDIINLTGPTTVVAGSTVNLNGSSITQAQGGVSSTPGHLKSDIQQNVGTLSSESVTNFFASYFGAGMNTVKGSANLTYNNLNDYAATLNGKKGVTIWIDQTNGNDAVISGSSTIGTASQPVLIIVNGNLDISGSNTIYGLVVVLGAATTEISGSSTITGGLLAADNLNLSGSNIITYNASVLSTLQQSSSNYYAKVAGTWKDY